MLHSFSASGKDFIWQRHTTTTTIEESNVRPNNRGASVSSNSGETEDEGRREEGGEKRYPRDDWASLPPRPPALLRHFAPKVDRCGCEISDIIQPNLCTGIRKFSSLFQDSMKSSDSGGELESCRSSDSGLERELAEKEREIT